MKRLRIYADTSIFGGCFDDEFSGDSRKFFEEVSAERFLLVISETTLFELKDAPAEEIAASPLPGDLNIQKK